VRPPSRRSHTSPGGSTSEAFFSPSRTIRRILATVISGSKDHRDTNRIRYFGIYQKHIKHTRRAHAHVVERTWKVFFDQEFYVVESSKGK
jgi:hypothetical protein